MKFTVTPPKPRNPFAAAAHLRRAGSHRSTSAALRQRSRQEMRRALAQLDAPKDSP
jgi:hypothetical protein